MQLSTWNAQLIRRILYARTAIAVLLVSSSVGFLHPRISATPLLTSGASIDAGLRFFPNANAELLRLTSEADRIAFRQWFTFIAEAQYFRTNSLPRDINDCAALLRFSYREALREHNSVWATQMTLPVAPSIPDVAQYNYPRTPVGATLFRVPADVADPSHPGIAFAEFADAETLRRFNTAFVSRDIGDAQSADLLFFRQLNESATYHAMIFVGRSQIEPGSDAYVVYHTGPIGNRAGEIRRLSLRELLAFPDARWHPTRANRAFLGVYRWNILTGAD